MSRPFDRNEVKPGTRLVMAADESVELTFKFMGHDGYVIASWVVPQPGRPLDVIARQGSLRIPDWPRL